MKYLIEVNEVYRVDSEQEASKLIDEAKQESGFILSKYDCVKKERVQKGETIDLWYRVSLKKKFNDEREPETLVHPSYKLEAD